MNSLRKLIICPYFGSFPEWMDLFLADFHKSLSPIGYELLLDTDLDGFKKRVQEKLRINCPVTRGSSKVWDYRCTLGLLYEEELKGYDYWGTCDFDVVFGDVGKWFPDAEISTLDVWSNHHNYVCGFWTLYKNQRDVNNLFTNYPHWKEILSDKEVYGWVEMQYSRTLEKSPLQFRYSMLQGDPFNPPFILKKEGRKLYQKTNGEWTEIAMLHFRRDKRYPL